MSSITDEARFPSACRSLLAHPQEVVADGRRVGIARDAGVVRGAGQLNTETPTRVRSALHPDC